MDVQRLICLELMQTFVSRDVSVNTNGEGLNFLQLCADLLV